MDIMIDTETLGIGDDAVILSIGAVAFNPYADDLYTLPGAAGAAPRTSPGSARTFHRGIDIFSQLMDGRNIEQGTVDWWRTQSPEAMTSQMNLDRKLLPDALTELFSFIEVHASDNDGVWAMPPAFDLGKIKHAAKVFGIIVPWSHRQEVDVRALRHVSKLVRNAPWIAPAPAMPAVEPVRNGVYHSALDDAIYQAGIVQWTIRNLRYGPA